MNTSGRMKPRGALNSLVLNKFASSNKQTGSTDIAIAAQSSTLLSLRMKQEDMKISSSQPFAMGSADCSMFSCSNCDKKFLSNKSLWVHTQTQHSSNDPPMTSSATADVNSKSNQDTKTPTCSDERFRFIIESSATRCQMTKMKSEASDESIDSKKSFARPVKPINYSDASRRQYIRERRDAALFKCPHCNRKYFTKRKLWFHKKKVHLGKAAFSVGSGLLPSGSNFVPKIRLTLPKPPTKTEPSHDSNGTANNFPVPSAQFHCGQCNLSFYTESHLEDHVRERHSHPDSFSLPMVDVSLVNPQYEAQPESSTPSASYNPPLSVQKLVFNGHSYPCHVCGKEFDKQNSLLMHLLRVHKTGSNIRKGYRKPPGEKTTYRRRRQVHSNIPPLPAAVEFQQNSAEEEFADPEEESYCEDDGSDQFFVCQICSKAFKTKETLRGHVKDYHTGRKYACDICGKCLSYQRNLAYHKRVYHKILS